MTRLDIIYAVNRGSRYSINSISNHDDVLKRVVRYLVDTKDLELRFEFSLTDQMNNLIDYTDTSYENCSILEDSHQSTSIF